MNLTVFKEKISHHQAVTLAKTSFSAAILIILLYDHEDELFLLVTKRSEQVETYKGHYCFPGGMHEASDLDFLQTAKREIKEELDLEADCYQIVGQLDDFLDRYHNLVRPYVAVMSKEHFLLQHHFSDQEIEKIYFFPLQDLSKLQEDESLEKIAKRHPSYKYVNEDVIIWGLTASIMVHLDNILFTKNRVVAKVPE